nr:hypothetical protein OH826_17650 [Streptomyces sp. NBC_00899]
MLLKTCIGERDERVRSSAPPAATVGAPGVAAPGADGRPDLWATWSSDDHLHFYPGKGKAGVGGVGFSARSDVSGGGWTTTLERIS